MRFGVLGEIQVEADGAQLEVGHSRQRAVLAILLVEAGRCVTASQLIDRIWDERPPQRARETLYSYISRLRTALGGEVIARRSGGYICTADPATIDLHRFRELVRQARRSPDEQAAGLWQAALALWRGEPFGELDLPWLRAVAAELVSEWLAATLEHNELRLRGGEHAALLPELSATAATNPLDERLAGQLMLALCRSGRQADALAHYRAVGRRLADELGHEPGPDLTRLHRQILRQAPEVSPPGDPAAASPRPRRPAAAATPSPVPAQLPADIATFTGRADALRRLDQLLPPANEAATVVISAIEGSPGVGKTTLAVHWAHRVRDHFPAGQLYANLRGFDPAGRSVDPIDVLASFLDALAVPAARVPTSLDDRAGLLRSLLAQRRMLILLDNARDAAQVRPLLPGTPGSLVLVTSRHPLTSLASLDGAHPLPVGLLDPAESQQLLRRRLGAERVAAEPAAVGQIVRRCAGLPLALAIVAARAAGRPEAPLQHFADEFADDQDRLDALDGGDPASDVRAVFSWSYRTFSAPAARLFRYLGLHPGPEVGVPAAASLTGLSVAELRPLLAELVRGHFVSEPAPGRYALHDLLRDYADELVRSHEDEAELGAARHRLYDHYLHSAYPAARALSPHRDLFEPIAARPGVTPEQPADHRAAAAWFALEGPALLAVIDQAAQTGFDAHCAQLAWTPTTYLHRQGRWSQLVAVQSTALAAARRLGDQDAQARALRDLGHAYIRIGQDQTAYAHLTEALHRYAALGDPVGHGHTYLDLGLLLDRQGRCAEALRCAEQALMRYRAADHRVGQARALNSLGWSLTTLGRHREAIAYCDQAIALTQELGYDAMTAATWHTLGCAHRQAGESQAAVDCHQRALALYQTLGDRYHQASTLTDLGKAWLASGDSAAAGTAWRRALSILDELGHPEADQLRSTLGQCG